MIELGQLNPGAATDPFFGTPGFGTFRRMRIGEGALHNNATDGSVSGGSWAQSFPLGARTITAWDYYEDLAQLSVVTSKGMGISSLARTGGGLDAFAGMFGLRNDAVGKKGWVFYCDALRANEAAGNTALSEMNVINYPGVSPRVTPSPYDELPDGMVGGHAVAAGGDASVFGRTYAVDWFFEFRGNGAAAKVGLNFRHNALMRESTPDDTTIPTSDQGFAKAISLAYRQGFSFWSRDAEGEAGSGTQREVARLMSSVTDPNVRLRLEFVDSGFVFGEYSGAAYNAFAITCTSDTVSGMRVNGAISGQQPSIEPMGPSANYHFMAKPKGTGCFYVPVKNVPEAADDAAASALGVGVGCFYLKGAYLTQRRA